MEHDLHVESSSRPGRDRARDPAHADQAEGLAGHAGAHHVGRPPAGPFAVAQVALALAGAARDREQQRHREIRGAVGQHFRRVGDGKTRGFCRVQIDVIETNAVAAENPGAHIVHAEHLRGDLVAYRRQYRVRIAQRVLQFGHRHRVIVFVELGIEALAQHGLDILVPAPGHDNFGFCHGVLSSGESDVKNAGL